MNQKYTLRKIAEEAGISHITVSRYFRAPEQVAKKTREKIENILADTHYMPNRAASRLAGNNGKLISVIVPHLGRQIFGEFVEGADQAGKKYGYQLMFHTTHYDISEELNAVRAAIAQNVDAIISAGVSYDETFLTMINNAHIPSILTLDIEAQIDLPKIGINAYMAAFSLADTILRRHDYKKIAYLNAKGPAAAYRWKKRYTGIADAVKKHHKSLVVELNIDEMAEVETGMMLMEEALAQEPHLDICFFGNDRLAIGGINYCKSQNIPVPEQISICGFNDSPLSQYTTPSLTTIDVGYRNIGYRAVEHVISYLENDIAIPSMTEMPYKIKLRNSTR